MVADWQVEMAARPPPRVPQIVDGSTPVVSFGDPLGAEFATVGINPSRREFQDGDVLLCGPGRRLATRESIGAEPGRPLTAGQARSVVAACNSYFARNPYKRWFSPLDGLLTAAAGASYYDGTACHLDLIQWATEPVWGRLRDPTVQRLLIEEGRPHFRRLLEESTVRVVLVNGRAVLNQMAAAGLCRLHEVKQISLGRTTCWLYRGERGGVIYVGWSTNLQSSFGVSSELRRYITDAVSALLDGHVVEHHPAAPDSAAAGPAPAEDRRYVPRGLVVASKRELAQVLAAWLRHSDARTIGDIGRYGGQKWITVDLGSVRADLNADTTRAAVAHYLEQVRRDGPDLPWRVIATTRAHTIRKVVFSDDRGITGWNCYLTTPLVRPATL